MYYVTMQITFPIPEFSRKERNLHCDVRSTRYHPANISQVGHMWPHVATSVFNMATSGNIIQVVRHLNAM